MQYLVTNTSISYRSLLVVVIVKVSFCVADERNLIFFEIDEVYIMVRRVWWVWPWSNRISQVVSYIQYLLIVLSFKNKFTINTV